MVLHSNSDVCVCVLKIRSLQICCWAVWSIIYADVYKKRWRYRRRRRIDQEIVLERNKKPCTQTKSGDARTCLNPKLAVGDYQLKTTIEARNRVGTKIQIVDAVNQQP